MVTLLGDVHFWTNRDDIIVKDADLGAFRYQDKNTVSRERVYYQDKKKYMESRGLVPTLKNSRPSKLRESLKEFEDLLLRERVVWEGWRSHTLYQVILASGLIISLTASLSTGDLLCLSFDKFLVGKLLSEHLADVINTPHHMVISYNECRLSVIHFPRLPPDGQILERISSLDPKIQTTEVAGPSGRRFERKLSTNLSGDMIAVWWQTSEDEVYPWSPLAKDRDRANILVYSLHGTNMDLVCFCRTEMAPISVSFSQVHPNVLLTVEQGFSKKGGVTILSCVYEVMRSSLHRVTVTTIPLDAPLMAHAHNPAEDRLLLACNNGVLALHCDSRGMTHVTKAGLIPSNISWLSSGNIVLISNERGQIQCFDLALSLIRMQLVMEDMNPQRILDLSEHFCHQQSLRKMSWAPYSMKINLKENDLFKESLNHLLLLHYARGPIACLRVEATSNNKDGLSAPFLVGQYIKHSQLDEAVNLLVSLNWDQEGSIAIMCLESISNHLLRMPATAHRENQLEAALGSFHVPVQPLSAPVEEEFGSAVRALTRRFFFHVLRSGRLEKAFRLAIDLKDHDCFIAVHRIAKKHGDTQIAAAALESAHDLESSCSSSEDSCSSVIYGDSAGSASSGSESFSETCSSCFSNSGSDHDSDGSLQVGDNGKETVVQQQETFVQPLYLQSSVSLADAQNLTLPDAVTKSLPMKDNNPSGMSHLTTHATAITSEDGKVTINIRQPEKGPSTFQSLHAIPKTLAEIHRSPGHASNMSSHRSSNKPSHHSSSHNANRFGHTTRDQSDKSSHQASLHSPVRRSSHHTHSSQKTVPPVRTVRELFYSTDPNEEFVDAETLSVFVDKVDLQNQYDRAVYHEVSTEEEDGGTVKVVHFGVV